MGLSIGPYTADELCPKTGESHNYFEVNCSILGMDVSQSGALPLKATPALAEPVLGEAN